MIFRKGKKYIFSKDVYLESDERVEKLNNEQINKYDGLEVQVGHSYLGYIDNSRISSSWCKEVKYIIGKRVIQKCIIFFV